MSLLVQINKRGGNALVELIMNGKHILAYGIAEEVALYVALQLRGQN